MKIICKAKQADADIEFTTALKNAEDVKRAASGYNANCADNSTNSQINIHSKKMYL